MQTGFCMRLTEYQVSKIKEAVKSVLGDEARVMLFGSRVDDGQRGGDIDIYVETGEELSDYVSVSCQIAVKIQKSLGDQKIDVLMGAPNIKEHPIHKAAKAQGIVL